MSDSHIFSEAFRCDLAKAVSAPIDNEHPTGIRFNEPCKCPAYQELQHSVLAGVDDNGEKIIERYTIRGCTINLLIWTCGSGIVKANETQQDIKDLRRDIHAENGMLVSGIGGLVQLLAQTRMPERAIGQVQGRLLEGGQANG